MIMENRQEAIGEAPAPSRVKLYILKWNTPSDPLATHDKKEYREIFRRGCFKHSILHVDITLMIDGVVVGSKCHGNLHLVEDDVGLLAEMIIPDGYTAWQIADSKFIFYAFTQSHRKGEVWSKDKTIRDITDAELMSVGVNTRLMEIPSGQVETA